MVLRKRGKGDRDGEVQRTVLGNKKIIQCLISPRLLF